MRVNGKRSLLALVAVGAVAAGIAAAPPAEADNSESCTSLNTGNTKCEKQGDVEINDSLARASTSAQWATQGGMSGGPFGGTLGGGPR
jgi:hypothetical protein